jgi:hypothetical protein
MISRVVTIPTPTLIIMTTLYTAKCTGLRKTKYMVNKSRQRRDLVKNLGSSRRKLKRPKKLLTGSCGSWKINSGSARTDPMVGATYISGHLNMKTMSLTIYEHGVMKEGRGLVHLYVSEVWDDGTKRRDDLL